MFDEALKARVVVPLDGSASAENAVPFAALLARLYEAEVEFVHVESELIGTEQAAEAEASLTGYAARLARAWSILDHRTTLLCSPDPATSILESTESARFVVMASHGRGGFRATLVGSVADKVGRRARIPVLTVPAMGGPALPDRRKPILVAVDDSTASEAVLELGRDIARRWEAPVALLHAWQVPVPTPLTAMSIVTGYTPAAEFAERLSVEAEQHVRMLAHSDETPIAEWGPAGSAIIRQASTLDAGLVVAGASSKGLAARVTLGSTAEYLMHSLHRPLLIVRK